MYLLINKSFTDIDGVRCCMLQLYKMSGDFTMSQEQEPQYFTVEEAAAILRAHPETIRRMARRGKIPGVVQLGDNWRIPRSFVYPPRDKPDKESRV